MTYPTKKLGDVLEYEQPSKYIVSSKHYSDSYETPVLTAGKTFILGNTSEKHNIFPAEKLPVIIFDDFTTATQFVNFPFKVKSSAMKILHAKKGISDTKYFYLLLQTIHVNHASHKRYWISEFTQLPVNVPPLPEQKKIVARIEEQFAKIDKAIKLREQSLALTEQLLPAALREVFHEKDKWPLHKVGDKRVMEMTSGGTPSRSNHSFYSGTNNWLKSGELNDNVQISVSEEHISDEAIKQSSAKIFPAGTVLFAMYGATAGKLGILSRPAATNQAVAGIIPNVKSLDTKYLYYCLLNIREEVIGHAWGGAQPNLSQTILKRFDIPVPPLPEQKKIVEKLDTTAEKARALKELQQKQLADLKELKQGILREVFEA